MRLPIIGAAYAHGRTEVTARTAKNLWFETRSESEKAPVLATHLPKLVEYASIEISGPFAFVTTDVGHTYVADATKLHGLIAGSGIVSYSNAFPSTLDSNNRLDFASDSSVLVMVQPGKAMHCSVLGGPITAITMPDSQYPISVAWLSGYFVILCNSGRLYWSPDGSTWGALAFATAEASADAGTKVMAVGNLLMVCGLRSIEWWAPTGNADLAFAPVSEAVTRIGVPAGRSACLIDGQPFFWGSPGNGPRGVYTMEGSNPVRVSPPDLERIVIGNVWLSGFSLQGHKIVALKSDEQFDTFWFDMSTGTISVIPSGSPFAGNVEYITDWAHVYGLSPESGLNGHFKLDASSYNAATEWELITDHVVTPDLDRFTVDKVRLDIASSGDVTVACSRDGGATWGSERTAAASAGQGVKGIVQFDRYGTAPQFTFKIKGTGKCLLSNLMINPKN